MITTLEIKKHINRIEELYPKGNIGDSFEGRQQAKEIVILRTCLSFLENNPTDQQLNAQKEYVEKKINAIESGFFDLAKRKPRVC